MKIYYCTQDVKPLQDLCYVSWINGVLTNDMDTVMYEAFEVIGSSEHRAIIREAGIKLESVDITGLFGKHNPVRFLKNSTGDYRKFYVQDGIK